jgi:predicted nucleotidyltransferase
MATARSLELLALARRLADGLPPAIEEVLLTGSASRGVADEDSDFELLLVGETLPPPDEIAAGLDVFDLDEMPGGDGWWIGGTVEGDPYELIAWTRARIETRQLADDLENVLRIVFALNREWQPGWKRLPESVAPLAIKPERLAERVDKALLASDLVRARALVRDTLALAPDLPRVVQARELTAAILAELA